MQFNFKGLDIYYEIHGEGDPLLILNGIMMTTQSWNFMIENVSKHYQVILVDLIDQGQSQSATFAYKQAIQVELIEALLDHLSIEKVNLLGISYGGEVALQYAVKPDNRLNKLILANTAAKTNYWLEEIGKSWKEAMHSGLAFYLSTIPIIYSPAFYEAKKDWMMNRKETLVDIFNDEIYLQRMRRLINSAEGYNVVDQLTDIKVPTYIIGATHDVITPIEQQVELHNAIPDAKFTVIQASGHASMYEKPYEFLANVLGFLAISTELKI